MIYRQIKSDGTAQVAIFAAIDVDDCTKRIVRPHEKVTCDSDITVLNQKKKVPQVCYAPFLFSTLPFRFPSRHNILFFFAQSHMDPVMLLYRENASVDAIVKRIMDEDEPLRSTGSESFRADSHCIWAVKRPEVTVRNFAAKLDLDVSNPFPLLKCRTFLRSSGPSSRLTACTSRTATTARPPPARRA